MKQLKRKNSLKNYEAMNKNKIKWTKQQRQAIGEHSRDVLVTASAGTGKTAVLSARCVEILAKNPHCGIRNILLVTFTEAAAEQMRRRIAVQLKSRINQTADYELSRSLKNQLLLLQSADISTFHSFCRKILKREFFRIGIDPDFSIIGEDEQMLLKARLLVKTVDWAWKQDDIHPLMQQILQKRDAGVDKGILKNVLNISDFLSSVVDRNSWLEKAKHINRDFSKDNELWQKQQKFIREKIQESLERIHYAVKLYHEFGENDFPQDNLWGKFIAPGEECLEKLEKDDFDKFAELFSNYITEIPQVKTPKDVPEIQGKLIYQEIKGAVDILKKDLSNLAILNPEYMSLIAGKNAGEIQLLVKLVQKFDALYDQAKTNQKCLDFSDLEHKALEVLTDNEKFPNELVPSETAVNLRKQYQYIFVDEYQDINPVQQSILKIISRKHGFFSVGDVKQSIYAFRGTNPGIFIKELQQANTEEDNPIEKLRVDLSENFRSSQKLLDFVNRVFKKLVSRESAGFDYDQDAHLTPGSSIQKNSLESSAAEMHILDENSINDSHKFNKRWYEAAAVAKKIKRTVGADGEEGEYIFDRQTGKKKKAEYQDIVILLRALSKKVNDYVQVLRLAGIPVTCPNATGFMQAVEITDCLSLLKVLDNPLRDIEFTAVLRSPFFDFNESELTEIALLRQPDSKLYFYEVARKYTAEGSDKKLSEKLQAALGKFENWRKNSVKMNLSDLLWSILRETGYLSYVTALPGGRQRKANLLYLHNKAIEFETFSSAQNSGGLSRFVEFIEKLEDSKRDWKSAEPETSASKAVRIMSIHKSKGLEFPVVILADTGSEFNKNDTKSECIFNEQQTLGVKIVIPEKNAKVKSLGYQVIAEQKKKADLQEQMRVLYVAMTRAEQKLVIFGSQSAKKTREIICKGLFVKGKTIPKQYIFSCNRMMEWLLYGLCDSFRLHKTFETSLQDKCENGELFSVIPYFEQDYDELDNYIKQLKNKQLDEDTKSVPTSIIDSRYSKIKNSLKWQYPYKDYTAVPAKSSVTELTHAADEYFKVSYDNALNEKPTIVKETDTKSRISGAVFGTAVHLLMANIELDQPVSIEKLQNKKRRLVKEGLIQDKIADLIDEKSLQTFFNTSIGAKALNPKYNVLREWKFTFALDADKWAQLNGQSEIKCKDKTSESVVVQGIIDMLIDTGDLLVAVDFKTDNIPLHKINERAEKYRVQLELYAQAAESIMKKPCNQKYLYFIKQAKLLAV